jgi:hypothetical protein
VLSGQVVGRLRSTPMSAGAPSSCLIVRLDGPSSGTVVVPMADVNIGEHVLVADVAGGENKLGHHIIARPDQ